jgi:hypothetical protein
MTIYGAVPDRFKAVSESYVQKGEAIKASKPVLLGDNKYYEITYNKKFIGGSDLTGLIILNNDGLPVDKGLLKRIIRAFYYYDIFFDNTYANLRSALKTDIQFKKEEREYEQAIFMLDVLLNEGVNGAGFVKTIINKLPSMKREANDVLQQLVSKAGSYEEKDEIFSEDMLEDIMPLYEKTMLMNFQRIKFIKTASEYYDLINKESKARRKKLKNMFNKQLQDSSIYLENSVAFFINILKYYSSVINFSEDRYRRYLIEKDNETIQGLYQKCRVK